MSEKFGQKLVTCETFHIDDRQLDKNGIKSTSNDVKSTSNDVDYDVDETCKPLVNRRQCEYRYDRGWSWIVMFGALLSCVCVCVAVANYGQLFVEIQRITGSSAVEVAWIGASNFVAINFVSPLAEILCKRYSSRVVVMTGGIIMTLSRVSAAFIDSIQMFILVLGVIDGIGGGLVYGPSIIAVSFYFRRFLGLATGVVLTGYSLAILASYSLVGLSIQYCGLKETLVYFAAFTAHCCVGGAVMFPVKQPGNNQTKVKLTLMDSIPKTPAQILLIVTFGMVALCQIAIVKYIPPLCRDLNISIEKTAWMFTVGGVADLVARIFAGAVSDVRFVKYVVRPYRLWASSMILLGVVYGIYPALTSYEAVFVNTIFGSAFSALYVSLSAVACLDVIGMKKYGSTYSFMLLGCAVFYFADVFIVAKLRDVTGTFYSSFYFLSGVALSAGVMTFFLCFAIKPTNVDA